MRKRRWFISPSIGRLLWYARQLTSNIDRRFFLGVIPLVLVMDAIGAVLVTLLEKQWNLNSFADSLNWALLTTMGRPPAGYVTSAPGWLVFWVLVVFGVALVGTITAALVAVVVNFL